MKPDNRLTTILLCVLVFSLTVAQGSSERVRLGDSRSISLPSYAILDEHAQPLISSSGKFGFISSVTGGSLIAFSVTSGKVLSSVVVGETAAPISMIETGGKRLIAAPAVNSPGAGTPATVSIIDATDPRSLELKSLLVLPPDAQLAPSTKALLTSDGKFCLVASAFNEAILFSFNVATGEIVSQLALLERVSEVAIHDDGGRRTVALTSAVANSLSIVDVDEQGLLGLVANFSPEGARLDESNNPAFSADGRIIYVAASTGDQIYALDASSGSPVSSLAVSSPQRITVAADHRGGELIGVMRIRRPAYGKPGGVAIIENNGSRLALKSEFTPPEPIEFSRSNNVVFDEGASTAFVGTETGELFAFGVETGELQSHQSIGRELRRIALSEKSRALTVVRSTASGDEVIIIRFDLVASGERDAAAPTISSLKPDTVEQGHAMNLRLTVSGENLGKAVSLVVNGTEIVAAPARGGRALVAKLPKDFFEQLSDINIQVKGASGALSAPAALRVVKPLGPFITKIKPGRVPGPAASFAIRVAGENFRSSSTIFIAGQPLNTERRGAGELRARVPAELARGIGELRVQVKDLAVPDVVSNEKELVIFGPRILELRAGTEKIIAGGKGFRLRIIGENFRQGAQVEIGGQVIPAGKVRRSGSGVLRLRVPSNFAQQAGKLPIVVRNPEGAASAPVELDARAPAITGFGPVELLAGLSDVKLNIRGENFLRHAQVYVGDPEKRVAFKVDSRRVRFHSNTQLVVSLTDELNQMIAQPGTLKLQVVNPNSGDGVSSTDHTLKVVGPEIIEAVIKPVKRDEALVEISITGANFRKGATVEFVKSGAVVRQQVPAVVKPDHLSLRLRPQKLDGMGVFELRVVNPGDVRSNHIELNRDRVSIGSNR